MKLSSVVFCGIAVLFCSSAALLAEDNKSNTQVVATPPVYVPNTVHSTERLPDGILAWDNTTKDTNVPANATDASFIFKFTNVSTNNVVILNVRTSCGCTTVQMPPRPWTLPTGTNSQIGVKVNFAGKTGTLFKTVTVTTDKGIKDLFVKINIAPPVVVKLSEADRVKNVKIATLDRQVVFKGDCATCHAAPAKGVFNCKVLYDAVCGICHEGEHRATMVPDLRTLKGPTNLAYWKTWIAYGKPGTLMPAFAPSQGGPLTDMQVATLAQYLAQTIPSHAPTNAP